MDGGRERLRGKVWRSCRIGIFGRDVGLDAWMCIVWREVRKIECDISL